MWGFVCVLCKAAVHCFDAESSQPYISAQSGCLSSLPCSSMMLLDVPTKSSSDSSTHSMAVIDEQSKKLDDERQYSDAGPSNSSEFSPLLGEGPSTRDLEAAPGYQDLPDDLPPVFAPYEAEYEITSSGNIFSHDRHLNEDGKPRYPI